MQPPYNDRWERTKRYLFRSLLQNPDYCLSPIPEEARSESSDDRPYSPLPDLIIEREPNRHDDSEEFYQGLERRVKKYYRRLFIDDVDCEDYEALIDNDEDSSEFEVNQSMASTLEAYNDKGMRRQDMVTPEIIHDPENINMIEDKTEGDSKSIESERRSDSSNGERMETNDFNVSRNITELNEEVSKTIDTESDSTQTHHRISTTVAQIHEEVKRTRSIMRVFEDGSPVLMPRFYKFNKTVFGNVSDIINAVRRSEESSVLDDKEQDKIEEIGAFDEAAKKSTHNESKESNQLKTNILDPDLEVESILESTTTVSNATEDTSERFEDKVTNDSETEESHDTDDVHLIRDDYNEEIIDVDNNSETTSESEEEQSNKEESIEFNEFNNNALDINDKPSNEEEIIEANKDSFEMLIRRSMFESKNKRKTSVPSTDEEIDRNQDNSEEFETIEVMRSNLQAELYEALRRQSSMSQEDPVITAIQASAERIEEDISEDDNEINASADGMRQDEAEMHEGLLRESAASQNGHDIIVAPAGSQHAENLGFSDDFIDNNVSVQIEKEKVSKSKEEATRSVIIQNVAGVCNDTWIVSPVENNFEELLDDKTVTRNHEDKRERENKRRPDVAIDVPLSKKKKYKNIETQTSAIKKPNKTWDCIKTDLFVGTPLIFKLCGCRDHVCS